MTETKIYKHEKYYPINGGPDVPFRAASPIEVVFKLPSESVFNLSKSFINWSITYPAIAGKFVNVFVSCYGALKSIEFFDSANTRISHVYYLDQYSRTIALSDHKLADFLSFADDEVISRSDVPNDSGFYYDGKENSINYTEQQYFDSAENKDEDLTKSYTLSFLRLKNTLFCQDTDLYFGSITYIKLTFLPLNDHGFADDDGKAQNGVQNFNYNNFDASADDITLYLSVQKNVQIIEKLTKQVMSSSGLNLFFDDVRTDKFSYPGNGNPISALDTIRYNSGDGIILKRVYTTFRKEIAGSKNLLFWAYNGQGATIPSYSTYLNDKIIESTKISTISPNEDYLYLKNLLHGSVIQSGLHFTFNWFWCDIWDNSQKLYDHTTGHGLKIGDELKYTFNTTATNIAAGTVFVLYHFSVIERHLNITPTKITVT